MICPNCKKEIDDDSKFCEFCGSVAEDIGSDNDNYLEPLKRNLNDILEDVLDLIWNRKIYKDAVSNKRTIKEPKGFYDFLKLTYASYAVIGVCRQIDRNKKSLSLLNLLNNLFDNPEKLLKKWFVNQYKQSLDLKESPDPNFPEEKGVKIFEKNFGKLDFVNPSIIYADIENLIFYTREIKEFRNKRIAHKNKKGKMIFKVNFNDLDKAINIIEELVRKYYLLLYSPSSLTSLLSVDNSPD